MTLDAIFFDLGKVMVTFDWDIAIPRFAAHNGGDTERVRQFLANPYHDAFERNEFTEQEFFERGRELTGFDGTLEQFRTYWNEIFAEIPSSIRLLRELAARYPLYALSNTNPWHAAYIEKHFGWMNLFTTRFYSFMLGVRKPDPRIYELALADAQILPARALMIDDRAENIEGAARVGMQTLHVPTPQILQSELPKLFPLRDTRVRTNLT